MKSILIELMTAQEREKYLEKGLTKVKRPGKQAITFAKSKEKKGESVTVSEDTKEDIRKFNNSLTESILLPIGCKGIFFEQDGNTLCTNYNSEDKTCMIGCQAVGVAKDSKCPYQPVDTQLKCPCYAKKEEV